MKEDKRTSKTYMKTKITKGKVVEIAIYDGNKYVESVKNGANFICVSYDGKNYGGSSPCDNQEEINNSIAHAKKVIIKEGDIPKVVDKRAKATLLSWI